MKNIIAIILTISVLSAFAQQKEEYMLLQVYHVSKTYGVESRLYVDMGTTGEHSMKNILVNSEAGSVFLNSADGTTIAIKNEVDFLNIISKYGFILKESYSIEISGKSYVQFVLVKKTG